MCGMYAYLSRCACVHVYSYGPDRTAVANKNRANTCAKMHCLLKTPMTEYYS
uniref:Uncharacterized protein n=1 Tax=Octopus bimaculoides TaxID=37653 RepID=A0A0L8FIF8_OCTBM